MKGELGRGVMYLRIKWDISVQRDDCVPSGVNGCDECMDLIIV